ncbi:hypothetical protein [Nannocystis sp. SCPEA4]|uniref:hypothetical protein n=1 Tax=Nannocystis sp. SCPEA4 TaxID=2996787 RepID=UPI00226D7EA5|nr:hypothetical protein [Nannocystis sp. SCPEA4]MCY1061751.1 hypothetical protein [Nannocystis sp. SCPEA4]
MTWSTFSKNFIARGCQPVSARAGETVRILVLGELILGKRPPVRSLEAMLYVRDSGRAHDFVPDDRDEFPVRRFFGRVEEFKPEGTKWSLIAVFELPADAVGNYQLLVGWRDQGKRRGQFSPVDAGEKGALFEVTP